MLLHRLMSAPDPVPILFHNLFKVIIDVMDFLGYGVRQDLGLFLIIQVDPVLIVLSVEGLVKCFLFTLKS
jgi:hypothetical protein